MKKISSFSITTLLVIASLTGPKIAEAKPQKKTCVVLSGGGARGYSHIGVLKVLEENRIPIDCIVGTSMGAVIGGIYASGMPAKELEKKLLELDLANIALDRIDRKSLPPAHRQDDFLYPLGSVGIGEGRIKLPSGAVQANKFLDILQNWTQHIPPNMNFDKLPIAYRSVATDMQTGEMVVFKKGSLHQAIRASMAAPGAFSPIEIEGRLLSDGGLTRNLPIDIAQELGATQIIAVNIGTPLMPREKIDSLLSVYQQMINILTEQNVNAQKKLLGKQDILIEPQMGDITFLDFTRAEEAIKIGEQAAKDLLPQLKRLQVSDIDYAQHIQSRPSPQLGDVKVSFVEVKNKGVIPPKKIKDWLDIPVGQTYSSEKINERVESVYNNREFDVIGHELVERNGEYGVVVNANEKSWGPDYLKFGLNMSSDMNGNSGYLLQIGHRRPWIDASGTEWRSDLELGSAAKIKTELRKPLNSIDGPYLSPYIDYQRHYNQVYDDDTLIAKYRVRSVRAGLDIGSPFAHLGEGRIGLTASKIVADPHTGAIISQTGSSQTIRTLPGADIEQYGIRAKVTIDQLDSPFFPRTGYYISTEGQTAIFNTQDSYQTFSADSKVAFSAGEHSINLTGQVGMLFQDKADDIPGIGYRLGGFQRLSAYQLDQFSGNYMMLGNLTYLYRALNLRLLNQSMFLGASIESGNTWNQRAEMSFGNLKHSYSVFLGLNTFMGPVHLGVATAPGGYTNLFFQLGRN